jgi:hypothetical protein
VLDDVCSSLETERTLALEHFPQALALEVLHHEVDDLVARDAEVHDRDGVLMSDSRRRFCLALKARDGGRIRHHAVVQDFDGAHVIHEDVRRPINRAHAALADT